MLTLADVVEALCNLRPAGSYPEFTEVVIDSREVVPGALFIALPGVRLDGHDFVVEAFERGASAAIVAKDLSDRFPSLDLREEPCEAPQEIQTPVCLRVEDSLQALQVTAAFWRRQFDLRVIGITGSVGKSTTKEVVHEVLNQRYRTLKNPGNLNNEIGLPLTLLHLNKQHERAVLEMGFYVPGEIKFLCDLALPQVGVVTNIGTVHAERAGSQEEIARGKAELVESLPSTPEGVAILNYDDPLVRAMAEKTSARVFFYGMNPQADLWADDIEGLGLDGVRFRLHFGNEIIHLKVPMIGRHSVHTALRASAVGLVEGLTWQEVVNGLRSERTQLRLVAVRAESGALILDDTYNASPESTLAALNLLDELEGRKVAVLGDMLELGPYEDHGHAMVGVRVAEVADLLITVGERAHIIAQSAIKTGFSVSQITELEESEQATALLKDLLQEGDVVLIKGSHGMRMDLIVAELEKN